MIRLLYIIIFVCLSYFGFGQGFCSNPPAGSVAGNFTLSASSICAGQSVTITDNSGGTDVKYIYQYYGETSGLSFISTPNKTNPYLVPGRYKILQYGKKGSQDMYACKTLVVRNDNKPEFSYTPCSNIIQITIPKDSPENDFDYYLVDWGDSNPPENVPKLTTTDYKGTKTLSLPRTIKVEGFYNSGGGCASPSAITIPVANPALGIDRPNHANISKLELTTAQNAALTINGNYSTGYDLFMTERGQSYPTSPIQSGIKPGVVNIAIPDSNKSYCFKTVGGLAACTEFSAEICTVVLNEVKPVNRTNEITWASLYPTQMTGIPNVTSVGRFLNSTTKLIKKGNNSTPTKISVSSTQHIDSPINCAQKYCYRVETETNGQLFYYTFKGTSLSKEICVDRKTFNPPAITDTFVDVVNNKIDINYTDNSGWTLVKNRFRLLREDNGVYKIIDSTANAAAKLKDTQADPSQQSYCYKVGYFDECNSYSLLSPAFCSVFLKDNGSNISWTPQSPFALGTITQYEVIPYDEVSDAALTAITPSQPPTAHTPDLSSYNDVAKYSVKATSSTGKVSNSNIISIPIKPTVLVPEAFSPNGDNDNEILKVFGTLRRVSTFKMDVYNRWGSVIFSTNDVTKLWDGKINDTSADAPPGMYFYKLYSKFGNGLELSKRGSVLLLR